MRIGFVAWLASLPSFAGYAIASAQSSPGALPPGPYAVGFRVVQAYDRARTYRPPVDHTGRRVRGETARPIQLAIWYPAREADRIPMRYGEYFDVAGAELGADSAVRSRRDEQLASFRGGAWTPYVRDAVSDSIVARILATRTTAFREAPAVGRRFPVVIHTGIGGALAQSILLEHLASHGFVVISVPLLGTGPAWYGRGEWTSEAMQAGAEDVGFALGYAHELPNADPRLAAVIGMGAHAGVLTQMRTGLLSGIVLWEGQMPEAMERVPGYDPRRVRIPLLAVSAAEIKVNFSRIDSLSYSDRAVVSLDSMKHGQMYQFQRVVDPASAARERGYATAAALTLRFLQHVLGDARPNSIPAGLLDGVNGVTYRRLVALPAVPTEAEFLTMVRFGRIAEAESTHRAARQARPGTALFSEQALTTVAFFMRRQGDPNAVRAYALVTDAYPGSARAWTNLGDAHGDRSDRAAAIAAYRRALELLPHDASLESAARDALERDVRAKLTSAGTG